jgi:hypothetical protein
MLLCSGLPKSLFQEDCSGEWFCMVDFGSMRFISLTYGLILAACVLFRWHMPSRTFFRNYI